MSSFAQSSSGLSFCVQIFIFHFTLLQVDFVLQDSGQKVLWEAWALVAASQDSTKALRKATPEVKSARLRHRTAQEVDQEGQNVWHGQRW